MFAARFRLPGVVLLAFGLVCLSSPVHAATIGFTKITNNGPDDVSSQLLADVTDAGGGQVLFKFSNTGPLASFIGQIYFDDANSVLSNMSVLDDTNPETSLGVSFQIGANPANLPSGNTVSPPFVADFAAGADNPAPSNGVNPNEMVGIVFDGAFANVLSDINSGALRLGLHVQGIGQTGNSDAFVSVPEPATAMNVAMMLAMIGCPLLRRRRS
jgi:hypothetical protein